jgi:Right handed beta helix region
MCVPLIIVSFMPAATSGPNGRLIRVPQVVDLDDALEAARSGDVILLAPGIYGGDVSIPAGVTGVTIRGTDRNHVVFEGDELSEEGFEIYGDDVAIENLTVHGFRGNGVYWESVDGFAARYLTVYNVGLYGIYALDSQNGTFEHSYVSGAADAAYYIGQCDPCNVTVSDVIARLSAIGYSGTNASGDMVVKDSSWIRNGTGIMPNSYTQEKYPPQGSMTISDNVVRGSGTVPTPAAGPLAGYVGVGIAVAGGVDNQIVNNDVSGSDRYGIALYPTIQRNDPPFLPEGNAVRGNDVRASGIADLALSTGSGPGNCFSDNEWSTSLPRDIERTHSCDTPVAPTSSEGSARVGADLAISVSDALRRLGDRPSYESMPAPPDQPNMPDAADLPAVDYRPDSGLSSMGVVMFGVIIVVIAMIFFLRPRKSPG